MQGLIIKGIGGTYHIKTSEGVIECTARGKFRFNEITPTVGDNVEISVENDKGAIEKILERKNLLLRPTVANVTQAFIVMSFKNPEINLDLLNKFLVLCEYNKIKVIVCFNKMDLVNKDEYSYITSMLTKSNYEYVFLKALEGYGIKEITDKLKDNISVFCGPSGVGKSTLLNTIIGKQHMETGDISKKLKRGKHTTRHIELVEAHQGFVVDTPGFSSLELDFLSKDEFKSCFGEFYDYKAKCKFLNCMHNKEPICGVKEAVKDESISDIRYNFYIKTLEELEKNNWRNKK